MRHPQDILDYEHGEPAKRERVYHRLTSFLAEGSWTRFFLFAIGLPAIGTAVFLALIFFGLVGWHFE